MAHPQNRTTPNGANGEPSQFGPYYLHELINRGGTAEIWMATNSQGEHFALRRLQKSSFFDFGAKRQFLRGCETLAQIHNHDYVIGYIEHGKINGSLYCLMEYVEGANLKQLYAQDHEVLAENVANILIDTALALEHVHDSGFIHLDFKPENILVSHSGNVRLVDFDLAQPRPEKPKKMPSNAGTPGYMAPEQIRHEPLDHRADIYSYGAMAYELLAGRRPIPGDTTEEVLRRQLANSYEVAPPSRFNPDVPPALEKIVMKCLERDPAKRYPFMSVVLRELQAVLYVK